MNVTRSLRRNNPGEMRTVPLWSFVVLCCLAISFGGHAQTFTGDDDKSEPARRHWDHFSYLIRLKNDVAREYWHDFAKQDLYSPVLYYTEAGTFVINPNRHILELTSPTRVASPDPDWEIYRLPEKYTDTLEFQFANSYSDDPGSRHYGENIMIFSSFDLTRRFIPVTDIQDWAVMVLHELFHSYQRTIPHFNGYSRNLSIPGGPDSFLGSYHADLSWYREEIYRENELLKDIWHGVQKRSSGISEYVGLREKRRSRILKEYGVDIAEIEDYEMIIEGHARYFESLAKRYMKDHPTDTSMLTVSDRGLISDMYAGYDPVKDKGLSDIYNNRYYYQLGYNLSMILEKYLPGYEETIYNPEINFNSYLEQLRGSGSSPDRN